MSVTAEAQLMHRELENGRQGVTTPDETLYNLATSADSLGFSLAQQTGSPIFG